MPFEIDAEGKVGLAQFLRQGEYQAESYGQGIALIGEDRKAQIEFFYQLAGKLGATGGDGQQGSAAIEKSLVELLQNFQFRIAVRSPGSPEEVQHQGAAM